MAFAAKAAGYVIAEYSDNSADRLETAWVHTVGALKNEDGEYPQFVWRPRSNNNDAFVLASNLGMILDTKTGVVVICAEGADAVNVVIRSEFHVDGDRQANLRQAIFEAAVHFGQLMP